MVTYLATNTLNGKFYVGSTTDFEWRKYSHLNSKRNYPFQNALRKHPESFVWEVFSDDSDEPVLEQALLDKFFGTGQCYNLNPTASRPPSQAGRPVSKETRRKLSLANKGQKRSPETCRRCSEAQKKGGNWRRNLAGSPATKRGENNPLNKKVEVVYPDGEVKVFCSTKEAGKLLGVSSVSVATHAKTNNTPTKGKLVGLSFRYL